MVKDCSGCGKEKPVECFSKCKAKSDGLYPQCKECYAAYYREYRKNNERNSDPWRDYHLRRSYGITLQAYNNLLTIQASGCAVCGLKMTDDTRRLCVDHCHKTGAVRALLCNGCNVALGSVNDDVGILLNLIDYLYKHKEMVE